MNKLQEIVWAASRRARQKRAAFFRERFDLTETTRILDIGSETGDNISLVLSGTKISPQNVCIADIDADSLKKGKEKFGFQTLLLDESGKLPLEDKSFDVVYCSSVIEHVTIAKNEIWQTKSENEFRKRAFENQKKFADEIRRVGKSYFVQTPARNFPIESHTWMPLFSFLPRPMLLKAMRVSNRFWIKSAPPDFNLLDAGQMSKLFPEAEIVYEKKFGLIKSIMAIKVED